MEVRPYSLPGYKILDRFRQEIALPLEQWSDNWGLAAQAHQVRNLPLEQDSADPVQLQNAFRLETDASADWLVVQAEQQILASIGAKVLNRSIAPGDTEAGSRFLPELGTQSILELAGELNREKPAYRTVNRGTVAECLESEDWRQDSRCILIDVNIDGDPITLWMPWRVAELFVEDYIDERIRSSLSPPLEAMLPAIGNELVSAQAVLGAAELSLDALSSLGIGDVVYLDKPLDETLSLNFSGTSSRFSGFLGKSGQNLAIKIENFVSASRLN